MSNNTRWEAGLAELEKCTHRRRTRCPAPGLVSDVATRTGLLPHALAGAPGVRSENQKVEQAVREMLRTSFGIG